MISRKAQIKDLLLPIAVVAIVGMMVFPFPAFILDVLLMCNITLAVVMIVSSVYLSEPEKFTSLPAILLLSTVFRLGLNISTTRQLLGTGEAPQIISTFGNFVVSGNIIVGLVVFTIITIVQFLVIAKGAERVAEVAARFTLDAMPGKQMSIDADIRSGLLTMDEARVKRLELQRESKLFGALDGAMKFVKGDAIAGVLITLINITAGLFVGVSQQGLSFAEAIEKYSIFTVGDGLVSQIPALLIAVAAGIVVTRVSDLETAFLSRDLVSQLGKQPAALGTTASVLLVLAFIPGLPMIPFLSMALIFTIGTYNSKKRIAKTEKENKAATFKPKIFNGITLELSQKAAVYLKKEELIQLKLNELRDKVFKTKGVMLPAFQFDFNQTETRIGVKIIFRGEELHSLSKASDWQPKEKEVFTDEVFKLIEMSVSMRLIEFLDDTHTRVLLDYNSPVCEDLINSVIPEQLSVTGLTQILRQLVIEGVSIKEIHVILQGVAECCLHAEKNNTDLVPVFGWGINLLSSKQDAKPKEEILAFVRRSLGREITRKLSKVSGLIRVFTLGPRLDHIISKAAMFGVRLEPDFVGVLIDTVRKTVASEHLSEIVILTTNFARTKLYYLLKEDFPNLRILSVEELSLDTKLNIIAEIGEEFNSVDLVEDDKVVEEFEDSDIEEFEMDSLLQ